MKSSLAQSGVGLLCAALCFVCGAAFAIDFDFNGDSRADILWRHNGAGGTGENYLYPLNGTTILPGEGYIATVSDMNWQIAGVGDFDGDGEADILWRNLATGENYIYLMGGTTVSGQGFIRTVSDLNWQVAGIGNFDGNSTADVLWRNRVTGQNYIYFMNGTTIASEGFIRTVADLNWKIAGIGDFDGDGKSDLLWRNSVYGENYLQPMDGLTTKPNENYIRTVADLNWKIVGIGDFDGDGKADILWRHSVYGENYLQPMDGVTTKPTENYLVSVANQNWQVVGVGNYDGNVAPATADILWRNLSTGQNYLWPMNGTTILPSEGYLRTVADRDWKVQPAAACPTVTNSAIAPSAVPSRTSGVAPLYVFFDATATTATATTRPFHELEYQWNFGDHGSGFWGATPDMPNLSRNLATGPVAAHVFETPGTYTVCATVLDGANTATTSVQITVTDPNTVFSGTNTLCVANVLPTAGSGGCPAGAAVLASSDFDAAINSNIANRKRILFKRGDTFTANTSSDLDVAGPGIIGAYGTGAKPLVAYTYSDPSEQPSPLGAIEISASDWRVMDLQIDGNSGIGTLGGHFIGDADHNLLQRLDIHHVEVGVRMSSFVAFFTAAHLWDAVGIVDCTVTNVVNGSGGNVMYVGGQRFAIMGNTLSDSTQAEHILRTPNLAKAVISHNNMSNPASAKHVVKLQAAIFDSPETPYYPSGISELVVISDNKFTTGTGAAWTVTIGPQDSGQDELVRNVIVERNWFAPHAGQQTALVVWAQDITVRNNLFNLTDTSDHRGMIVDRRGIEPPPANVHVYNNTFYSSSTGNFRPIEFAQGAGMIAKNNLGYAPSSTSPVMVQGTFTNGGNTTNSGILASPGFVSATPSLPADFALGAASSAINAGTAVPVSTDLSRRSRPLAGTIDRGAFEMP